MCGCSNEAFASQAVYSVEKLKIPLDKVNPNGGAIAFGHPLGATGARQIATAFNHGKRTGQKVFVTSMVSLRKIPVSQTSILLIAIRSTVHWIGYGNGSRVCQRAVDAA